METVCAGLSETMRSLPQVLAQTIPISVMPRAKCATAVPQAERGSPAARRPIFSIDMLRRSTRSAMSVRAPAMTNSAKADAERREHGLGAREREGRGEPDHRHRARREQALRDPVEIAALPCQQGPERHRDQQRDEQRPEGEIEERRADRNLVAGERLEHQRIERADENGRAGGRQKQIVEHQRAFPRDRREQAALLEQRRAPGEQREAAADEHHQDHQDEQAARRIVREGMNRRQHARAHQERADQRQREGEDRQQNGPHLERIPLFHHHGRMQQRGAGDPGHQRGVLHRIPEPPAAPAEFVIGPIGAHRDAERQAHPGEQRPRPHPARPRRIDTAFDQGRDGEGERNGEADIAEIEHRRMHRETEILQDRIEIAALDRHLGQPPERVRGEEDEQVEGGRDPGLHRQHVGLERGRQIGSEPRDQRAEERQDRAPTAAWSLRGCPRRW